MTAPDVIYEEKRKARKPHRCIECQQAIQPGERYQFISGVWDGRGDSFKQCLICAEISKSAMGYFHHWELEDGALCFGHLADALVNTLDFESMQEMADDMDIEVWKVERLLSAHNITLGEHA